MVPLLAFLFGITTKYADLLNEHGLKPPFKGIRTLSGITWGILGGALIASQPHLAVLYTALVMYWVFKIKLDFTNHAIGGVIMLLMSFGYLDAIYYRELVLLTSAYVLSGVAHSYWRKRFPTEKTSRLRFYLIPLGYSLCVWSVLPFLAAFMSLMGVECVNYLNQRYVGRSNG